MELFSHRQGTGEPLLILHGLFGSGDNWRTHAKSFSRDFDTHVLDLRNHGRSAHDSAMSYDLLAADVGWYITDEDLGPVHVIGHSMGGKVAMWLALQHPDLVQDLIVVDIAPREHPAGHEHILSALCDLDLARLSSRAEANKQISTRIPSARVRQFLLKNLHRSRASGFEWKMNLPAIQTNYDAIRGWPGSRSMRSDKRALFIAGSQSDYITIEDSDAIVEVFPRAQFVDIDAGHWLHAEQPEAFYDACFNFLEEPD
jgi:esterase